MKALRLALATAALWIGPVSAAAGDPRPSEDLRALRGFTREAMDEARVRGAAVALLREGQPVQAEAFGIADELTGAPVTRATIFEAASLGKVVAAYAALLEIEGGAWSLDMETRSPRMPIRSGCEPPTLGELLSHTAGLGNRLWAHHFDAACHPPAPFSYAGQGYLVLQDLFGDTSGERAERFVQQRIFQPLGMSGATYAEPWGADVAAGHADLLYGVLSGDAVGAGGVAGRALLVAVVPALGIALVVIWRRFGRARAAVWSALLVLGSASLLVAIGATVIVPLAPRPTRIALPSSLHASIDDWATFASELLEPRLVTPAARDRMFAPRARVDDALSWGAGIGIERIGDVTTWWQWGSNPGFQGLLVLVPERRAAVVVLTNTGGFADVALGTARGYAMAKRVARRALGLDGRWDLARRKASSSASWPSSR